MKKIFAIITAILLAVSSNAQTELWISGTAVPGGTQKLETFPEGQYKYAGTLLQGEFKIMTTPDGSGNTSYYAPRYPDSYVVNKGLAYTMTRSASAGSWVVPFTEDRYKFVLDTKKQTLKGEIFVPWREVYLAGGACEIGWHAFVMLPFTQDENDPNVFTWTGELREGTNVEEPRRFKLQGQNTWDPKRLHPYTQDEAVLESTQMRHGGDDTKWEIAGNGIYRITVNVFKDTFKAEFLGNGAKDGTTDADILPTGPKIEVNGHTIRVKCPEKINVDIYTVDSIRVAHKSGTDVTITLPKDGFYVVKGKSKHAAFTKKVAIN